MSATLNLNLPALAPELPPTSTDQPPQFVDLAQCAAWRTQLPVSNPIQAQAQLLRQLHLLNRYPLDGAVRLALLEDLRETILFVQGESAKKHAGKPLPLTPPEQAALDTAHGLWQALYVAYLHCLAGNDATAEPTARTGLSGQRALAVLVDDYCDQVRAGLHPEAAHWRRVHGIYARAEALGVASMPIEDGARAGKPLSIAAQYAEQMLLAAASLHELTPRQQSWVMRWARLWAGKLTISSAPPEISRALPLCVDLLGDEAVGFKPYSGPGARFLDTTALRKSLKGRIELLAADATSHTPASLGLGDDCPEPACSEMLRRLYPRWIKGGLARRQAREPGAGGCRFVVGIDAIHYYLSGSKPFAPPGLLSSEELRRQREELATFGRIAERFEDEYSRNHGFQLESWQVLEDWGVRDQSGSGLRLTRPIKQPGGRLAIGQLVAVQLAGASGLLLGVVRWVQIRGEEMLAGIQLFPGKPWPVAVKGTGVMAARESYKPGFVLPASAVLELPQTVVLPPGSFKPERIMELWSADGTRSSAKLKLKQLIDRGVDFERAAGVEYQG